MCEFDQIIQRIRSAAREQAEYRITQSENAASVAVSFYSFHPSFSEDQKEAIKKAAEDEAVRRIYANFHDIAIKSQ